MQSRHDTPRRLSSMDGSQHRPPTRVESIRTGINHLFSGRSSVGLPTSHTHTPDSPKTPRLQLGLGNFSSTRLVIPYLSRSNTSSSVRSLNRPEHGSHPSVDSTRTSNSLRRETRRIPTNPSSFDEQPPLPQAQRSQPRAYRPREPRSEEHNRLQQERSRSRRFVGVGPEEQHLAELATAGRTRRRNKSPAKPERRCAPKIKNQQIRSKILSCFISGLFLTLVLTIYLAIALTNPTESQEFHVALILVILITTIYFCHSLVRLCIMIIKPQEEQQRLPTMIGPGGFANPPVPIRIALARDEEAAGIESDATKMPPPAYGLWRESVRMDPNRIFWQRNEEPPPMPTGRHKFLSRREEREREEERPTTANRPPSYMSDNGIDYVLEAEGRSIAPTTEVPLPVHPSERGRVHRMP